MWIFCVPMSPERETKWQSPQHKWVLVTCLTWHTDTRLRLRLGSMKHWQLGWFLLQRTQYRWRKQSLSMCCLTRQGLWMSSVQQRRKVTRSQEFSPFSSAMHVSNAWCFRTCSKFRHLIKQGPRLLKKRGRLSFISLSFVREGKSLLGLQRLLSD